MFVLFFPNTFSRAIVHVPSITFGNGRESLNLNQFSDNITFQLPLPPLCLAVSCKSGSSFAAFLRGAYAPPLLSGWELRSEKARVVEKAMTGENKWAVWGRMEFGRTHLDIGSYFLFTCICLGFEMYLFRFWHIFVQILKLIGETNGPYEGRWNLEEHVLILVLLSYSWNVFVYILKCICLHFEMYLSSFCNVFVYILKWICLHFAMYLFRFWNVFV